MVVNLQQDDGEQGTDGPRETWVVVLGAAEADLRESGEPNEHAEYHDTQPEQLLCHQPQDYSNDMKESPVIVRTTAIDVLKFRHD